MGREIKFRVKTMWCDEIRVAPVSSIDDMESLHGHCYIKLSSYSSDHHGWDTHCGDVLMQYTGIKDKNGIEIYEGDILRGSCGIPPTKVMGEVVYRLGSYHVNTPHFPGECLLIDFPRFVRGVEVIGNIYENPELLEVANV